MEEGGEGQMTLPHWRNARKRALQERERLLEERKAAQEADRLEEARERRRQQKRLWHEAHKESVKRRRVAREAEELGRRQKRLEADRVRKMKEPPEDPMPRGRPPRYTIAEAADRRRAADREYQRRRRVAQQLLKAAAHKTAEGPPASHQAHDLARDLADAT